MKTREEILILADNISFPLGRVNPLMLYRFYQAAYADGQADENEACEEKCRSWNATLADEIRARRRTK